MKRGALSSGVLVSGFLVGGLGVACGEVTLRPDVYGGPWGGEAHLEPTTTTSGDAETSEASLDADLSADGGDGGSLGPAPACSTCVLLAAADNPQSLALDPDNVYWTNDGTAVNGDAGGGAGSVQSIARSSVSGTGTSATGGTPLVSGLTGPIIIACAGDSLVWSAEGPAGGGMGTVSQMGTSSSTPNVLATSLSSPWGVSVDATHAYWVASAGAGAGTNVQYADIAMKTLSMVGTASEDDMPGGLAVNSANIFFASTSTTNPGGAVFQVPIAGGTPAAVWSTTVGHPQDVAVDSSNLYWIDEGTGNMDGTLYSTPLTGGVAMAGLIPRTMASNFAGPLHLAVDSTNVYVADFHGDAVYEVPIDGGKGGTKKLLVSAGTPLGIAADNSAAPNNLVYFTTPDSIQSVPK